MVMTDVTETVRSHDGLCPSCHGDTAWPGHDCTSCLVEHAVSLLGPLDEQRVSRLEEAANDVAGWSPEAHEAVLIELAQRARKPTDNLDERVADELDRLRIRDRAWRTFQAEQHPPAVLPEIRSLKERLADPPPPVNWRIDGWQPAGTRVMLAAQFKAGKTTLTGNLARCLVDGDWWLDQAPVRKVNGGKVTVVDFEMSERQVISWLSDQKIINTDQILLVPLRGAGSSFNIIDDTTRARWAAEIAGTEYLIVDCLRPILDALSLDEHKDGGRFLTAFDMLCLEAGITDSLIVHHMGHTGERSRGDSRFRDWPDVEWRLVRETDDPAATRYISAYGRDVDIPESQLTHDPATRHLRLAGGNRSNAAARRALDDILTYLGQSSEPVSKRDLEQIMVAETEHVRKAVRAGMGIGIHDGQIYREVGAHGKHLLTLSSPARRSSPFDLASSPVPIGTGEVEHPSDTGQFAAPEEDPW